MTYRLPTFLLVLGLAACGGGTGDALPADDAQPGEPAAVVSAEELRPPPETPATGPDAAPGTQPPPAARPSPRAAPPPPTRATPAEPLAESPPPPAAPEPEPEPAALSLQTGTALAVTTRQEITSRSNKAGDSFMTTLVESVTDARGREVLPAGSMVRFRIAEIKEAESPGGQGSLTLVPVEVIMRGEGYPLRAEVTALTTEMRGRGVTAGDAGKVAAGAAAGAIVGKILGRKTGAVVGGVAGAAVGTAVAIKTADVDVVVPAGSRIELRLTEAFELAGS